MEAFRLNPAHRRAVLGRDHVPEGPLPGFESAGPRHAELIGNLLPGFAAQMKFDHLLLCLPRSQSSRGCCSVTAIAHFVYCSIC